MSCLAPLSSQLPRVKVTPQVLAESFWWTESVGDAAVWKKGRRKSRMIYPWQVVMTEWILGQRVLFQVFFSFLFCSFVETVDIAEVTCSDEITFWLVWIHGKCLPCSQGSSRRMCEMIASSSNSSWRHQFLAWNSHLQLPNSQRCTMCW